MAASPLRRSVVAILEGTCRRLWGFHPRLMAPIVAHLGPVRALCWFVANMPRYLRTWKAFGDLRTHLLCVAISLVNGCRYSTFGHTYAMELAYFKHRGELFPLDEDQIGGLIGSRPAVIRRTLVNALEQASLHAEVWLLDRTFALLTGDEHPTDRDELRIVRLVRMFSLLNAVAIADQTPCDQAHDPLNKDSILRHRYATLRRAPIT